MTAASDVSDVPPLPVVAGPTGSGKTALALSLAQRYPIEIVSADSRQIIRGLDLGTAKPTAEEQEKASFHLIDLIEPGESYSAFRFIEDSNRAIGSILSRGHIPFVVGGTGLYLRGMVEGIVEMEEADIGLRQSLEAEMKSLGSRAMWDKLKLIDPDEAERIHPNNKARILRALEIFYQCGVTKSELIHSGSYKKARYTFACYCLAPPRERLYVRINDRVDRMIEEGLVKEVELLVGQGLTSKIRQSGVIGYSELLDYLEGEMSLEEAVAMIKQNSRRFAKRQMTWFRKQAGFLMVDSAERLFEIVCRDLNLIVKPSR